MLIEIPAQAGESVDEVSRQLSYVALRSGRPDIYIAAFALAIVRAASHKQMFDSENVPIKNRRDNGD